MSLYIMEVETKILKPLPISIEKKFKMLMQLYYTSVFI